jgi:GNAT superfamily N-acetyltransferase
VSTPTSAEVVVRPATADDQESFGAFSCGDPDLDGFIRDDALRLQAQKLLRTYLATTHDDGIVGYVTLLADAVKLQTRERKKLALRYTDHPIVPALKIARLACATHLQRRRGVGTALVRFSYFTGLGLAEHAGCRLLTLDAYPKSISFYEKLGFVRNRSKENGNPNHPSMRLDMFSPEPPSWLVPKQ